MGAVDTNNLESRKSSYWSGVGRWVVRLDASWDAPDGASAPQRRSEL